MIGSDASGGASPPLVEPLRIMLGVWLANVAVATSIVATVVALAAALAGGTAGGRSIVLSVLVVFVLGGVAVLTFLRVDLFPILRRLAAASARGPEAFSAQVAVGVRKLLDYPNRMERSIGVAALFSLFVGMPAGALASGATLVDAAGWLPAGMVASLVLVRAGRSATRLALRPILAKLPPPSTQEVFRGSFARRVVDFASIPVAMCLFVTLAAEQLHRHGERDRVWLDRHAEAVSAIAGSPAAVGALRPPGAGSGGGVTAIVAVDSCDPPPAGAAGEACGRLRIASAGVTTWTERRAGRGYAAAPAGRGAVLTAFPLPPDAAPATWPLVVLVLMLVGVHVAGGWAGRRMGGSLRIVAEALERIHVEPVTSPPAGGRSPVLEIDRIDALVPVLAARIGEMRRTEERAIEALRQSQQAKTQFLASVSHDLKGPLNSILGFSELLLRGMEGPLQPPQRQDVGLIHRAAEDLLRIINGILDSAKLEAGRIDLARDWVPPVELVSEAVRHGRSLVGDKEVSVQTEVQPGMPPVLVDRYRVVQALECLVSNAVKFTDRGVVAVRVRIESGPPGLAGEHLRIDVSDQGRGIPAEEQDRMFEPFHQADASSSRSAGGTGLGLYLAKSLVDLHGGRIWFDSRVGRGSVFSIALPIEPPERRDPGGRKA
ncbi:MAG: HAMP domain-containing sensor histidine kinase [Myxococcota bacterium]|nr:HAMP domain-containing sensor histidine kinase [Myxococcota bacterium]